MAEYLSNHINAPVGGGLWRLRLEWTGSQSTSGNYTDVTAKLYWEALGNYPVQSSATKDCSIGIDGSWNSKTASGMASLSGYQKKLIHTHTKRINHDDEGKASVTLDAWFDVEANLNGYIGRINMAAQTWDLKTIPRASTLSSSPDWVAGEDMEITLSRASTSFSHEVDIRVQRTDGVNELIKSLDFSTSETSKSTAFPDYDNEQILGILDGRESAPSFIVIRTYNGGTLIGTNTYEGVVSKPSGGFITGWWQQNRFNQVYVDDSLEIAVGGHKEGYSYKYEINLGNFTKFINNATRRETWTPNSTEKQSMYNEMSNTNEKRATFKVTTYYQSMEIGSNTAYIDYFVRNSDPIFPNDRIGYSDSNLTTRNITGSDQYIISEHSTLTASIDTAATAQNGASISNYVISVGGLEKSRTSTGSVAMGKIESTKNVTLSIQAIDSRGNSTTATKTVTVLPYDPPLIASSARRVNNFESDTIITLYGAFSPLNVGGADKNLIQTARFRTKQYTQSTWGTWTNFSVSTSNGIYTATDESVTLDNIYSWDIEVEVIDKLGAVSTYKSISKGSPVVFIDADKETVGIGMFPTQTNAAMETAGNVHVNVANHGGVFIYNPDGTDAVLRLETAGGEWAIRNDESETNELDFRWNGSTKMNLKADGSLNVQKDVTVDDSSGLKSLLKPNDLDFNRDSNASYINQRGTGSLGFTIDEFTYKPMEIHKEGVELSNGYNITSMYSPYTANEHTFIQHVPISINVTNGVGDLDISFPVEFDRVFWVVATPRNAASLFYNPGIYNIATSGCRVYINHIRDDSTSAASIDVTIVAGGVKK